MLILKITISRAMDINCIDLDINEKLIMCLSDGVESSPDDGGGSPSFFILRRMLMINPVNIKMLTTMILTYR